MRFVTAADVKLKKRRAESHKGENGKVLVVGGSIDYVGAAYLAGMAAFRSGVDAVVVAAPAKVAWAINCLSPDFITKKFRGDFFTAAVVNEIVKMSKKFDVTLIGNGIGKNAGTLQFAAAVCNKISGFKVIDADAISAVRLQQLQNAIVTPHIGEYGVLMRNSGCRMTFLGKSSIKKRGGDFKQLQRIIGTNVLLLKGHIDEAHSGKSGGNRGRVDAIISKDKVAYSKTGNAGMTVGGTGDVLAGLCAGLLAQEKNLFKAAAAAAYANGKAGDLLLRKYGYGFTASNLLQELPAVLKRLWKLK